MEKVKEQGTSSTQVILSSLNAGNEIGLTEINGIPCFENLFVVVGTDSTTRIVNILEIQRGSKSYSFGVGFEW